MTKTKITILISSLLIILLLFFHYKKRVPNPAMTIDNDQYFPNYTFTSHEGKSLKFFDDIIKDKIVLINFIYTSCGSSCPLETARLRRVQTILEDKLGKDFFFYSISVDPDNDTVEQMKEFHGKFKLSKGWVFLRGSKSDTEEIQKKYGVFTGELTQKNLNDHSLSVIVGNQKTGQWIRRSHLENPTVLANLIESLNPKRKASHLASYKQAPIKMEPVTRGEHLFFSRCIDCHSIGKGDDIGPDLLNVTKRRNITWLRRWIQEPDVMLQNKDPIAVDLYNKYDQIAMPNLRLSKVDVDAIIEYLKKISDEEIAKKTN